MLVSEIGSTVPDPLDEWLDTVFDKYNRLDKTTRRSCLIIAPLYGDNTGTKQIPRWELDNKLVEQQPRDSLTNSEKECREIRHRLLAQIPLMDNAPDMVPEVRSCVEDILGGTSESVTCPKSGASIDFRDLEKSMDQTSVLGYNEVPVGLATSPKDGGSFELGNVGWLNPPTNLYDLRNIFKKQDDSKKLLSKVQRKTYRTDRRLTGLYKTNREARWESHPADPQTACRWDCWEIENKLLSQVFGFENAPDTPDPVENTVSTVLDSDPFADPNPRCPVTGSVINYTDFMTDIRTSDHGRSDHHVGHIDPLATTAGRHEVGNTTWITERGNRVQGDDSLSRTTHIIFNMAEYHADRLGLDWNDAKQWTGTNH